MDEHDVVELTVDLPEEGLPAGTTGVVVDIYRNPPAYEVEFVDPDGRTLALLPLRPEQIRRVSAGPGRDDVLRG